VSIVELLEAPYLSPRTLPLLRKNSDFLSTLRFGLSSSFEADDDKADDEADDESNDDDDDDDDDDEDINKGDAKAAAGNENA
jgi:hypothetical protein